MTIPPLRCGEPQTRHPTNHHTTGPSLRRYNHHGQPIMHTNHQHHHIPHLPVSILPAQVLLHTRVIISSTTINLKPDSLISITAHPRYKATATCLIHPYHRHQEPLSMPLQQQRQPKRRKRTNTHALMQPLTLVLPSLPPRVMQLAMERSIPVKRASIARCATRPLRGRTT